MQADLRPGDRIADCVVESELGRGGMGVVYRAREESLQRTVAVKVISPALAGDAGFARRFEREARLAASIEHPSVVPIHAPARRTGGSTWSCASSTGPTCSTRSRGMVRLRRNGLPGWPASSRARWTPPTPAAWYTATSSRPTSCCVAPARTSTRCSPTSG